MHRKLPLQRKNVVNQQFSFADAVKLNLLSGANAVPIVSSQPRKSVFGRLIFPSAREIPFGFSSQAGPTQVDPGQILNSGSRSGQTQLPQYLSAQQKSRICLRCLSEGHAREACRSAIRCFACRRGGHIARNCTGNINPRGKAWRVTASLEPREPIALETGEGTGLRLASPPIFSSFAAWANTRASTSKAMPLPKPIVIPWRSMTKGPKDKEAHLTELELCLGSVTVTPDDPPPSLELSVTPHQNSAASPQLRKPSSSNPLHPPLPLHQASLRAPCPLDVPAMAFQRAQPGPFLPDGWHIEDIPNRPLMVRAVVGRRPQRRNEDLAIATITLLPDNPLHFPVVEDILREYLEQQRGTRVVNVQPCHLGQAYVRFASDHERDRFVLESPHPYDNVHISFVRHDQGRNWRRVLFNQECWLMIMGLPNDYWE